MTAEKIPKEKMEYFLCHNLNEKKLQKNEAKFTYDLKIKKSVFSYEVLSD